MAASPEVARLAKPFAQGEWKKALPATLQAMNPDDEILAAGMAEWIRGSAARSDFGYYFVTRRGLHFGVKERSAGLFRSPTYRDEFVPRESIGGVQADHMQALELDGADGRLSGMIVFPREGLQYSDQVLVEKAGVEQARVVANALGHTFD